MGQVKSASNTLQTHETCKIGKLQANKVHIKAPKAPIGHFDIADPSSMQDACHHELSKYDLCSPRVSQ